MNNFKRQSQSPLDFAVDAFIYEAKSKEEGINPKNRAMLSKLRKMYSTIQKVDPNGPAYKKLKDFVSKQNEDMLKGIVLSDIKWLSYEAGKQLKTSFKYSAKDVRELEGRVQESLSESELMNEDISKGQLIDLEKFADRLLAKFKIDVEFTRHFGDRANDKRNTPAVKVSELQGVFKKIFKDNAKQVLKHQGSEAVLKDIMSDLNLPFILKRKDKKGELELVLKTIMRKKNFSTSDPVVKYESTEDIHKDNTTVIEQGENAGSDEPITEFISKALSPLIFNSNYKAAIEEVKKLLIDTNVKTKNRTYAIPNIAANVAKKYKGVDVRKLMSMVEHIDSLPELSFRNYMVEAKKIVKKTEKKEMLKDEGNTTVEMNPDIK
jgi:hypothetical protein